MSNLSSLNGQETVYKEYSCRRWNYWTYVDGLRYTIKEAQFNTMVRQGAKTVVVK